MIRIFCKRQQALLALCSVTILLAILILGTQDPNPHGSWVTKVFSNPFVAFRYFLEKNKEKPFPSKNSAYLVDTPNCKIPKFDPYDPEVMDIIQEPEPYECPGKPIFMYTQTNSSICANETILKEFYKVKLRDLFCTYQGVRRKYEKPGNVRENNYELVDSKVLKFGKPIREDFVVVHCDIGIEKFTQYIPIPRIKKSIEKKKASKKTFVPHLNIIAIGIDSISKLNFFRHFKKTQKFLDETMHPLEMNGYTKIGDNTFPNLIGMLSGRMAEDLWNESASDTMYFDDVDLIWKRYAEKGYRTFFAEDMPIFGTFNYFRRGFHDPPTDYYYRPMSLAIYGSDLLKNSKKSYCLNSQTESEIMYDYLKAFTRVMDYRPYFAFLMVSALTHYNINEAGYMDAPTESLLKDLWYSGALNNSVLVIFGDHGVRFGQIRRTYIGKFEERMPFMYIHFPSWFLKQYPEYAENLNTNQERLVTLLDVHATFVHLLDPTRQLSKNEKKTVTPYGESLLNEISFYRTCEQASIKFPWCVCMIFRPMSPLEVVVVEAASVMVDYMNELLEPYGSSCADLKLGNVIEAKYGQVDDSVLRFEKHENTVENRYVVYGDRIETYIDYLIKITTYPNYKTYDGTIRYSTKYGNYTVLNVKIVDSYYGHCIDNKQLQEFCYCK